MQRKLVRFLMVVIVASMAACAIAGSSQWTVAVFPSGASFRLELAEDDVARARGYMFRERVGPREGMLFLFDESAHHSFWMKNCKVALDIIWLDEEFRVVEIAHDRQPCIDGEKCPSALPMRAARHVLEVAAGIAEAEELQRGDRLVLLEETSEK